MIKVLSHRVGYLVKIISDNIAKLRLTISEASLKLKRRVRVVNTPYMEALNVIKELMEATENDKFLEALKKAQDYYYSNIAALESRK